MKNWQSKILTAAIITAFLFMPGLGRACPKCYAATAEQTLHAYYFTSLLLIAVPLGIISSIGAWVFLHMRKSSRGVHPRPSPGFAPEGRTLLPE